MLPDLAIIVAAYVVTRMLQILVKQEPKEHGLVVAFAALTILLTIVMAFDILSKGSAVTDLPGMRGLERK